MGRVDSPTERCFDMVLFPPSNRRELGTGPEEKEIHNLYYIIFIEHKFGHATKNKRTGPDPGKRTGSSSSLLITREEVRQ